MHGEVCPSWRIHPVGADCAEKALRLLFTDLPKSTADSLVERTFAEASQGSPILQGLHGAWANDKLLGVSWAQLLPGRTASIVIPRAIGGDDARIRETLLSAVVDWARGRGACLLQALLESAADQDAVLLKQAGFEQVAQILYLVCQTGSNRNVARDDAARLEKFQPADETRMAALIEQTYKDSLDCPELEGKRAMQDVLAGYRATGDSLDEHWFFLRKDNLDVGCLIMAEHREHASMEIVYVGLRPSVRRLGLGKKLVRGAQRISLGVGAEKLTAAVDSRNIPALAAYNAMGFHTWDRRHVFLQFVE